jgi:uncharacterized protein (TIRG00374 family)
LWWDRNVTRKWKSALILAVGLGLGYWFVRRLDWQEVTAHLREAQIWPLILAAVLINLTLLVRALRWQAFLAPITQVSLRNAFAATSVGFGSVFVVGRAGEIVRPMILSLRARLRPSATIATILIERLYDMSMVVGMFAVNLLFFKLPEQRAVELETLRSIRLIGAALLLGVIVGIAALVLLRLSSEPLLKFLELKSRRLPERLVRPLLNLIRHLAEGLSVLLNLRELITTSLQTLLVWGLIVSSTWLVIQSFGLSFSLSQVIFVLGFGLVGSVVPTPGGSAGAFHAAAAAGLIFLGVERNHAASVAIVLHLVAFGPPFVLGLFYLVRDDIGLARLREMMAQERAVQVTAES